jgi:HEAT repeat protein
MRARVITALAATDRGAIGVLFRQLLGSPQPVQRQLACLGCGMIRDAKSIDELAKLTYDTIPIVFRSACLALVAIGSQAALEGVAETLLHGNEDQRQAAAEALANHPEEGHPTLQEGARLDDLLVRKAVIAGLKRVRQPWANQLIEKMRVEDPQWVVKNAASEAVEEMSQPLRQPPKPLPILTETPWLISYAGERGVGVAPGRPALDLLLLALREGKEEQRLAALEWIKRTGESAGVLATYHAFFNSQGDVNEAAYDTLWHLAGAGIDLPEPAQFGLGRIH